MNFTQLPVQPQRVSPWLLLLLQAAYFFMRICCALMSSLSSVDLSRFPHLGMQRYGHFSYPPNFLEKKLSTFFATNSPYSIKPSKKHSIREKTLIFQAGFKPSFELYEPTLPSKRLQRYNYLILLCKFFNVFLTLFLISLG